MNRLHQLILLSVFSLLSLNGCQNVGLLTSMVGGKSDAPTEGAVVRELDFSDDLKLITARLDKKGDFGAYHLDDTSMVKIEIREYDSYDNTLKRKQPVLLSVRNSGREALKEMNANVLVIMDMTLDKSLLERHRKILEEIRYTFSEDNMFLAFMLPGGGLSAIYPATPYIMSTYTYPQTSPLMRKASGDSASYLYRSLVTTLEALSQRNTSSPLDSSASTSVIVFSGSQVYDRNTNLPLDPMHYHYQEELIRTAGKLPADVKIYYIGENDVTVTPEANGTAEVPDINIMKLLCNRSGGIYIEKFSWSRMRECIRERAGLDVSDLEVTVRNCDGQLYVGNPSRLEFRFYTEKDSLLTCASKDFVIGGTPPLVVGTFHSGMILFKGALAGLLLMLLVFLIFQFAVPFVQYLIFRHKYIIRYHGPNMTFNDIAIPDQCHMCKSKFHKGDNIVVKCAHVVHEECWEENEGRCPEHGRGCRDGSHFYNRRDLLDWRNASFYMKWILVAAAAGTLTWISYFTFLNGRESSFIALTFRWMESVLGSALTIGENMMFASECYNLLILVPRLVSLLTVGLSILTVHKRIWYLRSGDVIARAVLAGAVTFVIFLLYSGVITLFHLGTSSFSFIPWSVTVVTVVFISTFNTRIKPVRKYVYYSLGVGMVNAFIWNLYVGMECVSDILHLLMAVFFFCVGAAAVVARALPRHEHYFLHLSGPVKEMDVALYKWFAQKPDARVTIGKSVDCSIQITWDLKSDISPIHAEICLERGLPRLCVVDGTVTLNGETVDIGRPVRLYHNDTFVIGLTGFRYLEM